MTSRWVLGARPRTLPVAVVPVAVGTAAALGFGEGSRGPEPLVAWRVVAALIVSLALQVATNFVNDYADGERGTDDTRVGPVRLVASGLATAREVKVAALVAFAVAGVAGGALAYVIGWELVVVGAVSMLAGWAYTGGPKPYGYLGLGEVFVFVFFGLVATVGSFYVQTETVNSLAFLAAIPVGLLAVALLVVNNLRDIPGDTASGKQTLAVRLGDHRTRQLYIGLLGGVAVGIVLCSFLRPPALIGLVGLVAARGPVQLVRNGSRGRDLIPVLGMTGKVQLLTGLLLAGGLVVGALVD